MVSIDVLWPVLPTVTLTRQRTSYELDHSITCLNGVFEIGSTRRLGVLGIVLGSATGIAAVAGQIYLCVVGGRNNGIDTRHLLGVGDMYLTGMMEDEPTRSVVGVGPCVLSHGGPSDGDNGAITLLTTQLNPIQMQVHAAAAPTMFALYLRHTVVYITAVMLILATTILLYTILCCGCIEVLNLFQLQRVGVSGCRFWWFAASRPSRFFRRRLCNWCVKARSRSLKRPRYIHGTKLSLLPTTWRGWWPSSTMC
ncbi:Aste57867_8114 [Aphanomyces stellatus]|uniref:Aste57867_8114 protein n=1 Tax=Aphanomyces stellatus TaxID=120398 RepID=A0A485KJF9_9STRA|nr:hypothetical protein As57867_008084 [Aphanomyces stellatus]VFT85003.1 Aste57867_8114 [Aphanomyces stellatus]